MDQYKVDFHIHTKYSDGLATPVEIVRSAKELEYDMIAITDHDGIDGIKEALIAGETAGVKVIPGIELATVTEEGIGLHILGYYFDHENPALNAKLEELRQRRDARNHKLVDVLKSLGYDISMEELLERQPNGFIGKPVIARLLTEKGYIDNYKEAFKGGKMLDSNEAKAVKKEKILASEAIELIKNAGGIAVLAHPIQTRGVGEKDSEEFYKNIDAIVRRLKIQGLKGLECYHPDQNHEQTMRFVEMAEKYHLHITRGSDFHGKDFADADPTA
ncbi:MAG: PHP domain-containing protein [Bacillota bacterium]|nr:PHP domain-containing protein [Bacillota bacterium]